MLWKFVARPKPSSRFFPLATLVLLALLSLFSSCGTKKPELSAAATAFRQATQGQIDRHCPALARKVATGDRRGIEATLNSLYEINDQAKGSPYGFLAVLDKNGVTIAAKSRNETTGTQNYGNYQIVSRVLNKGSVLQSTLYLRGGRRVFIIGVPLLRNAKVSGALILGIDPEYLHRPTISEREFMALPFVCSTVRPS